VGENEVDRVELQTKIGTLQIQEEDIIQFPTGILGFADIHRYVLVEQEESFFSFLQSVDEPALTFVVMIPELVCCEYSVKLNEEQIELLQFDSPEDGKVYAIVTVPENVAEMTVNLQAPVVINSKKRLGAQIVITDSAYHTKHNVLAEMQKNAFFLGKQKVDGQKAEEVRESV
jgi:flagellar assembly factor FliW